MKKIAIIITVIVMISCKEKLTEKTFYKPQDEIVNEAASASINRELSELDNNIIIARDTTKNIIYRNAAINKIRHDAAEYLHSVTTDNIFSPDFEGRLENQKKFIAANCRQTIINKLYKQLAIEQVNK